MAARSLLRPVTCLLASSGLVVAAVSLTGTAQAAAVVCPTVSSTGVVSPAPAPGVDWSRCDLAGANLASANLTDANFYDANLTGANLTNAILTSANLSFVKLYTAALAGADLTSANLDGAIVTDADMTSADLSHVSFPLGSLEADNLTGANLSFAALGTPNIADLTLTGADLNGTVMASNGILVGVVSGGITGVPANLPSYPSHWRLANGYLIGPGAILSHADLAGLDLAGAALDNADLTDVNFTGADMDLAQFGGSVVTGTQLAGANLDGVESGDITGTPASLPVHWNLIGGYLLGPKADLVNASLVGYNLSGLDLAGAYSYYTSFRNANFDGTDLAGATFNDGTDLTGATFTGANLSGVTWSDTTCPDGTNSDRHIDGCFSGLDATPPVMTVTGVRSGGVYAIQQAVRPDCQVTDKYSPVTVSPTLTISSRSSHGLGVFTATCSGAQDRAGNSAKTVSVTYTVAYGFSGFYPPLTTVPLARSSREQIVIFNLQTASGQFISRALGAALSRAHHVRITLRGPGIATVRVNCGWHAAGGGYFRCVFRTPRHVRVGRTHRYLLTAYENTGFGFVAAPGEDTAVDPLVVHFR